MESSATDTNSVRDTEDLCIKIIYTFYKMYSEMLSDETYSLIGHAIALGLTGVFVIFVILYGLIIAQQLLFSLLVALSGVAVYILWLTRS